MARRRRPPPPLPIKMGRFYRVVARDKGECWVVQRFVSVARKLGARTPRWLTLLGTHRPTAMEAMALAGKIARDPRWPAPGCAGWTAGMWQDDTDVPGRAKTIHGGSPSSRVYGQSPASSMNHQVDALAYAFAPRNLTP